MGAAPLQTGLNDATGANQFVASFLQELGVPDALAVAIGAAVVFFAVLLVAYFVGKALLIPLTDRLLGSKGLDEHARRPLRKILGVAIAFAAIAIAFGVAGYGSFLQSLATVAAAATLAIGFAMQDVIGDWIEWDGNSGIVEDISFRVTRTSSVTPHPACG